MCSRCCSHAIACEKVRRSCAVPLDISSVALFYHFTTLSRLTRTSTSSTRPKAERRATTGDGLLVSMPSHGSRLRTRGAQGKRAVERAANDGSGAGRAGLGLQTASVCCNRFVVCYCKPPSRQARGCSAQNRRGGAAEAGLSLQNPLCIVPEDSVPFGRSSAGCGAAAKKWHQTNVTHRLGGTVGPSGCA